MSSSSSPPTLASTALSYLTDAISASSSPKTLRIGVGSGSTIKPFIALLPTLPSAQSHKYIPTSHQASAALREAGLTSTALTDVTELDFIVDGADEVDMNWNLIKGGGGCLVQEKIVASAKAKNGRYIVVVKESKRSRQLGTTWTNGIPIEVIPSAVELVKKQVRDIADSLGYTESKIVCREASGKAGPVITDNGNMIIDAHFGVIKDAAIVEARIKSLIGVVDCGLFIEIADLVIVEERDG